MQQLLKVVAGWVLIVIGLFSLALPILQGVLLLVLGGVILSRESPWARLRMRLMLHRFPRLTLKVNAAARLARAFSDRVLGRRG